MTRRATITTLTAVLIVGISIGVLIGGHLRNASNGNESAAATTTPTATPTTPKTEPAPTTPAADPTPPTWEEEMIDEIGFDPGRDTLESLLEQIEETCENEPIVFAITIAATQRIDDEAMRRLYTRQFWEISIRHVCPERSRELEDVLDDPEQWLE